MIGCVSNLKYLDLGLRDRIKLLMTVILVDCLMASHKWRDFLKSIDLYPKHFSHPRTSYIWKILSP